MKTLLVIVPGKEAVSDAVFSLVHAETGEGLASHFCSNYLFAYGDLYESRPERIKEWTERFGEHEVKFIDETDVNVEELFEKNNKWYEEYKLIQNEEK